MVESIWTPDNPGWAFEHEDWDLLKEMDRKLPKTFRAFGRPAEVLPQGWHRIENQGPMGSCRGHSGTSCMENQFRIATGGEITHFSPLWFYLATQQVDGLLGRDAGSTISGGIRIMQTHGCPLEVLVPYPSPIRYPSVAQQRAVLKPANYEAGQPFRIETVVDLRSHEEALDWIGGGNSIDAGMAWPIDLDRHGVCRQYTGRGRGGHAVAALGYRRNNNIIFANSHGTGYGDAGWFEMTPQAFTQMLRHRRTALKGVSDMAPQNITPRRVKFSDLKIFTSKLTKGSSHA